ncbi:hypothetical protein GTQ40_09075 [Flavobacteriaceae bacterium R38]|nr:hypothetical protein [Flavobacteriaceae bacterium R38]
MGPSVITILEEGHGVCLVDFGDESEKKENQESEKEKVYFASYDHIDLKFRLSEKMHDKEYQMTYQELPQDIVLPPPEKSISLFS